MLNFPLPSPAPLSRCCTIPFVSVNQAWLSSKQAAIPTPSVSALSCCSISGERNEARKVSKTQTYTGAECGRFRRWKESQNALHQLTTNRPSLDFTLGRKTRKLYNYSRSEGTECADNDKAKLIHGHNPVEASLKQNGLELPDKDVKSSTQSGLELSVKDVTLLAQYMTPHNFVRVLEISRSTDSSLAGARVLLLDKRGNVHSVYQRYKLLTDSYYDIFAALPAVIPQGPIGIFGLGAGTAARLIQYFWPEIDIHGWELDPGVIQAARKFFDLEELEWKGETTEGDDGRVTGRRRNSTGSYSAWQHETDDVRLQVFSRIETVRHGRLKVHEGDALSPDAMVEGGFAGLIVDVFQEGAVIPALQLVETWLEMRTKLRRGGRIIVNCGGSCVEASGVDKKDGGITMLETIAALADAFPGELSIMSLKDSHLTDRGDNSLALTGPPPDLQVWKDTLPECLRPGVEDWKAFVS